MVDAVDSDEKGRNRVLVRKQRAAISLIRYITPYMTTIAYAISFSGL